MITTAQINSQTPRSFRLNLTPPYRPPARSGAVSGERDRDDHRGCPRACSGQAQRQAQPQHRGGRASPQRNSRDDGG